ncbi:uncharacterized protein LOC119728892 [Patiria miniata]|uniref:Uncharacterized protein n=1 Tax=Patiria miniata TaxID=46514 RepID=A0A914A0X8_PATMI|nr:uncharacterized protein LOC119728892 [Patiria miniata]XP_038057256.1 uncharacterized protein LOC119728892 [Patiria miniata]
MEKSSTSEGGDGTGDVVIPRKRRRTGEKEQRTRHALPVECIICKKSKWIQPPYGPRKKEPLTKCEYEKGQDMVAIEVRYHRSCHKNYIKATCRVQTCVVAVIVRTPLLKTSNACPAMTKKVTLKTMNRHRDLS